MRARVFVCGMALTLAACTTTVGVDEAFSGDTGNSYVLIAGDGMQTGDVETHDFKFQRVDMASSTFLKEYVYVRFGHKLISGGGDEFQKPATMAAATVRYAGHKIAPGDYALVFHEILKSHGTMATRNTNCYSRGAAVYRFREGAINIVQLGSRDVMATLSGAVSAEAVPDPAALQAQVAEVLAGYPNMTAPGVVAKRLGTASFESKKNCSTTGRFSFTRFPGVSVDW